MNRNPTIILVLLTTALIGAASYLIFQNQKLIDRSQEENQSPSPISSQPASPTTGNTEESTPSPSPTTPSPPAFQPTLALTQNAIKTNVNAKNYSGLIPYITTPKVFVTLQATECCGDQTPQQAVEQMKYIDSGISFDFNQDSTTIQNLKSKNPQLAEKFIGISSVNENMVAFGIDNKNHISNIEMSASYKLYTQ